MGEARETTTRHRYPMRRRPASVDNWGAWTSRNGQGGSNSIQDSEKTPGYYCGFCATRDIGTRDYSYREYEDLGDLCDITLYPYYEHYESP